MEVSNLKSASRQQSVLTARAFLGTNWRVRESYCAFLETRATNSSNLESRSFRMGDSFDFL